MTSDTSSRPWERVEVRGEQQIRPLALDQASDEQLEVRHQWPYDFGPSTGRLAVIQPWEFGAIPQEWVEPIRSNVDEIWEPSEYVRQMYAAGGVDPAPVKVVPNGLALHLFRPRSTGFPADAPPRLSLTTV